MADEGSVLQVDSLDQILKIATQGVEASYRNAVFSREWSTIRIRVTGDGYGAEIPGEQLRTLWELQECLYRLAAYALHGTTDIRSLTQEERHQFEFKVTLKEGSWISEIATAEFWSSLFENTVGKMSGAEIGLTFGACTLLVCGCVAWNRYNRRLEVVEQAKEQAKTSQQQAEALVRVVESFNKNGGVAKNYVEKTGECLIETAEKLAKRGHNIKSIAVAGNTYGEQELDVLRARAKSVTDVPDAISSLFVIEAIDKSGSSWSLKLQDVFDESEIYARLAPDAIDGDGELAKQTAMKAFNDDSQVLVGITLGSKRNLITSIAATEEAQVP